jgi:hypothetical protein
MAVVALAVALVAPSVAHAGPSAGADFDGDGNADLAVGAPLDSVSGRENAGAVNVIYGSRDGGLDDRGDDQFTQDTFGMKAFASRDDLFGDSLAAGNLNGDRYDDLAIGAPGEDVGGKPDAGAVHVLYGSARGLSTRGDELVYQDSDGIKGGGEAFDRFGDALAIGFFRGWRSASLAIGVPGDSVGEHADAGAVNVLRGDHRRGVHAGNDELWTRDTRDMPGAAAADEQFGAALAAGDLSRNGRAELAIGAPGRTALQPEGGIAGGGSVTVLYGNSRGGLETRAAQRWRQNSPGIKGLAEFGDGFGAALAIGDFDDDGEGDLAVGAPFDTVGGRASAGAVNVIYGSIAGLQERDDELWTQDARGIGETAERRDVFGAALAAADFSRNGVDDLAVGVPRENVGGRGDAGIAHVLYGRDGVGLGRAEARWHQGSRGVKGALESGDQLGFALAAGDFDGDGDGDLAAGAPFDSVGRVIAAGAVNVLYGTVTGVSARDDLFTQGTSGIKGAVGQDLFGAGLGRHGLAR